MVVRDFYLRWTLAGPPEADPVSEESVLKAVVDTNVLVNGTILSRKSLPGPRSMAGSQFILVLSSDIVAEIGAVLRRPKIFKKYGITENLLARLVNTLSALPLLLQLSTISPYSGRILPLTKNLQSE